ncbi:MAG: response regulator [Bdellovibrionota bacterium]
MAKVLIVDDALLIRMQLKKLFEETLRYEVVALGQDGNEAVTLFKQHQPDLVTLDITMPNKDGLEALKEILAIDPSARIFVVSAIKDSPKITEALKLGAKGFLSKPLEVNNANFIKEFVEEITEAMES